MKRSKPDENQEIIVEALESCGFVVFSLHNVPSATGDKALAGLPDLLAIDPRGLTIIGDFDSRAVIDALAKSDAIVLQGATILAEVKTPSGKLTADQVAFWQGVELPALVLRRIEDVFNLVGRVFSVKP